MAKITTLNRETRRMVERHGRKARKAVEKITKVVDSLMQVNMSDLKMPVIVVFDKPSDFPDNIVARIFDCDKPTNIVAIYDSIDHARADAYGAGFGMMLPRSDVDDPVILESYWR